MKKRLLALALCLVLMTSLLPMIAYGDNPDLGVYITGTGFEMSDGSGYALKDNQLTVYLHGNTHWYFTGVSQGLYKDKDAATPMTNELVDGETYFFKYMIACPENPEAIAEVNGYLQTNGYFLTIPGYTTSCIYKSELNKSELNNDATTFYIVFEVTKIHEHNWQLTPTDSSLTFTCGNPGCTIGTVGVAITAHSVTLPDSPFNAQVEYVGDFKEAFSGVEISDIRYDYEDSEGVWHQGIDPIPANAKAGRYQAGVCVSGFSGNGGVAARAFSTDDGFNAGGESVFLWVQYTAVDPAVTTQTGDNRPIELMMASVLVFSALAAAAFVLDGKRKYRQ